MKIEVCIDNIESLHTAIAAGADRIELCSALALGGLTPSLGLITQAVAVSSIPIYVMIRPRDGDFVFSDEEIHFMEHEIHTYKQLGVNGVVIGALNPDATINEDALRRWTTAAQGVGVTFHRAFDLVANPLESLELLCHYSIERILTSGLQPTAPEGKAMIKYLVETAQNRLSIMAGLGSMIIMPFRWLILASLNCTFLVKVNALVICSINTHKFPWERKVAMIGSR